MSGHASGWVWRHGPRPEDVDRDSKKYGARARVMRMVLGPIADAANEDGEHSHPGNDAIVNGSLYSRAHVMRTLTELQIEGWLEIEEQGGGRGMATVWRMLPGPRDVPIKQSRGETVRKRKPSHSKNETVSSDEETVSRQALDLDVPDANVITNVTTSTEPRDDAHIIDGRSIARDVWERRDPKPAKSFIGIVNIFDRLLAAGWSADQIRAAAMIVPTISTGTMEFHMNRQRPTHGRPIVEDRDAREGRIDL